MEGGVGWTEGKGRGNVRWGCLGWIVLDWTGGMVIRGRVFLWVCMVLDNLQLYLYSTT